MQSNGHNKVLATAVVYNRLKTFQIHSLEEHKNDEAHLGEAEKFLLLIISVPCYGLRIDSMLMEIELPGKLKDLEQDMEELHEATKGQQDPFQIPLLSFAEYILMKYKANIF